MLTFIGFHKRIGQTRFLDKADGVIELLYMNGLNNTEIARLVGCTHSNISQWRDKRGYPKNDNRGITRDYDGYRERN